MIYSPNIEGDGIARFTENNASRGSIGMLEGDEFIKEFLKN